MKYRKSVTQGDLNGSPMRQSRNAPPRVSSSNPPSATYENIKLVYDKINIVLDYPLMTCNCYCSCKNVSICCVLFWVFILIFLNYGHYVLCRYNVGMCFPFSEMLFESSTIVESTHHIQSIDELADKDNNNDNNNYKNRIKTMRDQLCGENNNNNKEIEIELSLLIGHCKTQSGSQIENTDVLREYRQQTRDFETRMNKHSQMIIIDSFNNANKFETNNYDEKQNIDSNGDIKPNRDIQDRFEQFAQSLIATFESSVKDKICNNNGEEEKKLVFLIVIDIEFDLDNRDEFLQLFSNFAFENKISIIHFKPIIMNPFWIQIKTNGILDDNKEFTTNDLLLIEQLGNKHDRVFNYLEYQPRGSVKYFQLFYENLDSKFKNDYLGVVDTFYGFN